MAKYLDDNGLLYYNQKINTKLSNKVDKETGKGLSSNDYTSAEKTKLGGIETGAEANVIESISVNGAAQTITSKNVDLDIITESEVEAIVNEAISGISGFDFEVVQSLPQTGEKGIIYLLSNNGTGQNIYDEYIWLDTSSTYEKIGSTNIDLSHYWQNSDSSTSNYLTNITNAEIDTIVS